MDICNAVLMDLIRKGEVHLEKPNEVLQYVFRAIDNEVRDAFRQLSRLRRDFRRQDTRPVESHLLAGAQATTPSAVLVRREVFEQVREILAPPDQPILDMVLEDKDWSEIGERLGIEPDTARMRFQRAVRKLRDHLAAFTE
jgi:RNA polymerase sigma factor (sigma-70 family)